MRCPDCNKFVSYDEPLVEVQDNEIDSEGMLVRGSVRIVLPCAECSQELKETNQEFEMEFSHECPEGTAPWPKDSLDEQYELDGDVEGSGMDRMEDKDRHGNPIKSARYMKHFYGADLTASVLCNRCSQTFEVTGNVEEQASGFDELV